MLHELDYASHFSRGCLDIVHVRRDAKATAFRAGIHFRRRLAPDGQAVQNQNMTNDHDGDGLDAAASRSWSDDGVVAQARSATTSPELVYSLLATENMWRLMDAECGLLTERDVAQLLRVPPTARNWVSERRKAGQIIGVRRGKSYRYPGFQFDRKLKVVFPLIETLLDLARANEWTTESLSLWMLSPSTSFAREDRAVDHLREPETVMAAAKLQMEERW